MRVTARILKAFHSMRLTRASLSVSQYGGIIALEHRAYSMLCCAVVDVFLRRIHIVHMIKTVSVPHRQMRMNLHVFRFLSVVHLAPKVLHARNRLIIRCHLQDGEEEAILFFSLQRGSHSNHDFEIVLI